MLNLALVEPKKELQVYENFLNTCQLKKHAVTRMANFYKPKMAWFALLTPLRQE
jgi:hypothetical protein